MIAVDTNILVYAHRSEFRQHSAASTILMKLADGQDPWAIPVFCIGEFLRVVTHPIILKPPSAPDQAISALRGLLRSPSLRVLLPSARFPALLLDAVQASGCLGNLTFDVQIATVCREHGVRRILTNDRDFARFPDLEIQTLEL